MTIYQLFEPVTIDEPATETETVEEEAPAPLEDETESGLSEEVPESGEAEEIGEVTIEAEASEPGETPDETGAEPDAEAFVNEPVTLAALDGAGEAVKYKDGTYTGSAKCEPDEDEDFAAYTVTVTVTIAEGRVSKIEPKIGGGVDAIEVKDGAIATTEPAEDGKGYTITIVSDNYGDISSTATYTAAQSDDPTTPNKPDTPVTPAARTRLDADDKLVLTDALKAAGKTEDSIKVAHMFAEGERAGMRAEQTNLP